MKRVNNRRTGQTATEYMMVVSVIVIALVGASYAFVPTFQTGVEELGSDVSAILRDHGSARRGFGVASSTLSEHGGGATRSQAEGAGIVGAYDPNAGLGDAQ